MTFRIEFGREAKRDLWGYYEYASQRSRADAIRWLERFEAAIGTLAERPERCSLSRESRRMQVELRDPLTKRVVQFGCIEDAMAAVQHQHLAG